MSGQISRVQVRPSPLQWSWWPWPRRKHPGCDPRRRRLEPASHPWKGFEPILRIARDEGPAGRGARFGSRRLHSSHRNGQASTRPFYGRGAGLLTETPAPHARSQKTKRCPRRQAAAALIQPGSPLCGRSFGRKRKGAPLRRGPLQPGRPLSSDPAVHLSQRAPTPPVRVRP